MSPFDPVVDYTVKMWASMTQRFVMLRCGIAFIFIEDPISKDSRYHIGEVECGPNEFLASIMEAESTVRERGERCGNAPLSDDTDWAGWWDGILFDNIDPDYGNVFTTSQIAKAMMEKCHV